jgi:ribulose-5-phosphate 4-epimerase/fuculose-1-phosphate aldolase
MEEYEGVKFRIVSVERVPPKDAVAAFLRLDKSLAAFIHPQKNEGNLSIRVEGGFLIKRTGAKLTTCVARDAILVLGVEGDEVRAAGGVPSSESRMHWEIYRRRQDAGAILHFHDDALLASAPGPEVGPFHYGTPELADAVGLAAGDSDIIKIRNHGLVIVAKDGAGLLAKLRGLFK